MKPKTTSPHFFSPEQRTAAIAAAPDVAIADEENPPTTPDDWRNAIATHGGGIEATLSELHAKLTQRRRGKGHAPLKVPTTIRFDADVLEELRATGKGWQTRVNEMVREWLKSHPA